MALPFVGPIPSAAGPNASNPGMVELILKAVREHLGMDVAFASRVADGKIVIQYADTGATALIDAGAVFNAEDGYCQRVLDGRLPFLIPDASKNAEAARLDCTREMPIGAHLSIPLRLSDGSVYGTFCCFSRTPDPTLNERDLNTLQAFAELAATQIEAELANDALHDGARSRIREVVEGGTLAMVLQPICRLEDSRLIGFEALARFPDHEQRPPTDWFEEAQQLGLGRSLELAAVRTALGALPDLPHDLLLAVNVSPDTLLDPELAATLAEQPGRRVIVEVTEHAIVKDYEPLKQALGDLRESARIAIDDAGAGYSGLRHILDLRPDIIKLDMSLTRDVDHDPARSAMTSALVRFARDIGSMVVAEGVESDAEYQALRKLKVDAAQGHFIHRPMPVSSAVRLARSRPVLG